MKKVLILLAMFVLTLTSINGACTVNVDEYGWVRVKDRNWEDLSSSYQEHCLKETCNSLSIDQGKVCNRKSIYEATKSLQEELQKKADRASSNTYPRCSTNTYNKEFKIDYHPSKPWNDLSVYEKYLCGENPKYEYQWEEVRERQALEARQVRERQKAEQRNIILFFSILFILFISLTFSYKKISRDKIKRILNNPKNKTRAVKDLKKLLQKNGYRSITTTPDKLLYKKYSLLVWCIDTVEINIKSFLPFIKEEKEKIRQQKIWDEQNKPKMTEGGNNQSSAPENLFELYFYTLANFTNYSGRARRKEWWTFLVINSSISLLLQFNAPQIAPAMGLIIFAVIPLHVRRIRDIGLPGWWGWILIPLMLPMLIISFMPTDAMKSVSKTVGKKATDFMSDKQKPKDMNDVADALKKYHSMLETGAISKAEYDQIKKDLLNIK